MMLVVPEFSPPATAGARANPRIPPNGFTPDTIAPTAALWTTCPADFPPIKLLSPPEMAPPIARSAAALVTDAAAPALARARATTNGPVRIIDSIGPVLSMYGGGAPVPLTPWGAAPRGGPLPAP